MATRGEFIFTGYIPGTGMVRVFQDMDSTTHVFALPTKADQFRYVHRTQVQPRRTSVKKHLIPEPAIPTQPTLF